MKKRLVVKIWDNQVTVFLKESRKTLDAASFRLENNLSDRLLPEIDKMLKKNKLEPKDIEKAEFRTNIKNSFTTVRIGKVIVNTFNWTKDCDK